jgi:hypothetical protein
VHLGDPTGEREAEADPAPRFSASVRLTRGLATVEGREDALALGRRDAGARVRHRQHDAVVIERGRERDGRRAVLGGVLEQVPERAPQQRFVGDEVDGCPVLDPERDVCSEWVAACALGEVGQERFGANCDPGSAAATVPASTFVSQTDGQIVLPVPALADGTYKIVIVGNDGGSCCAPGSPSPN